MFFHGGPRGLTTILPAAKTGADCTSLLTGSRGIHDPRSAYVTTSFDAAMMYAAGHERGCVYEVDPINLRPDPDCSQEGLSWECDSARVLKRHRIPGKQLKMARRVLLDGEP